MGWRSVLALPLASCTYALAYGPIRWVGLPAGSFVISPRQFPNMAANTKGFQPQELAIMKRPSKMSPDMVPYFTANHDGTITWMGLCVEAGNTDHGYVARINLCSGGPAQQWNWLQKGHGQSAQIQLEDSRLCLDLLDTGNGLNGAPLGLQPCESRPSGLWKIDDPSPGPTRGHARKLVFPSALRYAALSSLMLVALWLWRLNLGLWPWVRNLCAVAGNQEVMPVRVDLGGVCLIPSNSIDDRGRKVTHVATSSESNTHNCMSSCSRPRSSPTIMKKGRGSYKNLKKKAEIEKQQANTNKWSTRLATGKISQLEYRLRVLECANYPSYKDLESSVGEWPCGDVTIMIDRVQGDPFAPPSYLRARVPMDKAGFPSDYLTPTIRNVALCDFLTRAFSDMIKGGLETDWTQAVGDGGGWAGPKFSIMGIEAPGQFVLPRTSVVATTDYVEVRFRLALPARGRTIQGHRAAEFIGNGVLPAVQRCLFYSAVDQDSLWAHIQSVEDQDYCRNQLSALGLIGFIANGSVLPRKSGVDNRPMTIEDNPNLVSFTSPESLQIDMTLPHSGHVQGMGIKQGITLIVGGGFHGKSSLLEAMQLGIYNKVPGDGREFVVFDPLGVKVRAEDGRFIAGTDISPFINNMPFGTDTRYFSTPDASGSTSQAANIIEALEMGATSLLIDEDTCATNFMIRDVRMQSLVAPDSEPITAFIQKVRPLFTERKVSTVMIIGGTGDFFEAADTVIQMDRYVPKDVTKEARQIVEQWPISTDIVTKEKSFGSLTPRELLPRAMAASGKVSAHSLRLIKYGETEVELTYVEQLVEIAQVQAIADCLQKLGDSGGDSPAASLCDTVEGLLKQLQFSSNGANGLDTLSRVSTPHGSYALPRKFEIAAAVSRLRTLQAAAPKRAQEVIEQDLAG